MTALGVVYLVSFFGVAWAMGVNTANRKPGMVIVGAVFAGALAWALLRCP